MQPFPLFQSSYNTGMPKKKTPKPKAKKSAKKRAEREDVNQAAFRVVQEATREKP